MSNIVYTTSYGDTAKIDVGKTTGSRYVGSIIHAPSNCKFSIIDNIGSAYDNDESVMKKNIDELLKNAHLCTLIQTISKPVLEFIIKNYETYAVIDLPIGYYGGFQYHIYIRNHLTKSGNFHYARTPIKAPINVEQAIKKVFKDNRRKNDIIPDIIKEIEKLNKNE